MSARAKAARAVSGGAVMMAATAIAVMFHVTPILAQSDAAPAPDAGQSAPAASPAISSASEIGSSALPMATAHNDKAQPGGGKRSNVHYLKGAVVNPFAIRNDEVQKAGPEQQRRIEKERTAATTKLNSPEFRKQMVEAQRKAAEAAALIDSPEFK